LYKIPANTLFIGKNLVYVPECHSTNTLAAELSQKTGTLDGTVVITDRQTAGKGQRGNVWETEAGKNLTFSVILKPSFVAVRDQFNLTIMVSLAVHTILTKLLGATVKIKWPNDILVNDKKICGILIENSVSGDKIQNSIIGIGLNVNQDAFPLMTATSMKLISGKLFDANTVFAMLLEELESYYLQLRSGMVDELMNRYLSNLYWINETHVFRVNDEEMTGMIQGVDRVGRLNVKHENGYRFYDLKEISFVK
jgi:BirA family biotin operon repressor/biotin-[acetyl-CoA-carboxylase] ligase